MTQIFTKSIRLKQLPTDSSRLISSKRSNFSSLFLKGRLPYLCSVATPDPIQKVTQPTSRFFFTTCNPSTSETSSNEMGAIATGKVDTTQRVEQLRKLLKENNLDA